VKKQGSSKSVIILICIYLIVPLLLTFLYSVFTEWSSLFPSGLTLKYYRDILSDGNFLRAVARTVIISAIPFFVCTIVVLLVLYVIVVYHPGWDKYVQMLCNIPYAIQGIILAISVLSLYVSAPEPFSNRFVMVVLTYCIVILPYIYRGLKNSLDSMNAPRLIEAAQMLGVSKFYAFFAVVVPGIVSGLSIVAMLSISIVFGDFAIVNIIGGSYYQTAQMFLYKKLFVSGQASSAIIVVMFGLTLILSAVVNGFHKRRKQ
jgi:ABC-type spermidine/putrescine transport system, permease component II